MGSEQETDSQSHKEEALGSQGKTEDRDALEDPKADWIVPFFSPKLLARGHCLATNLVPWLLLQVWVLMTD